MLGLNPYGLLASVLVTIALIIGAYLYGEHNANVACDLRVQKIYADAAAKAETEKKAEEAKANTASTQLETKAAAAQVIYRTITRNVDRVVTKPVYSNVCLEPEGLAIANAALAGINVVLPTQLSQPPMMVAK
jgi:hypothetical protein